MKLEKLVERLEFTSELKNPEREITAVCFDSRKAIPEGSIFICIRGAVSDGHDFAQSAVDMGAACIVADHKLTINGDVEQIVIPSTRRALSVISAAWFGYPAEQLKTIGITGTKGKSTTSYMIKNILERRGLKVGVIGTIGVCIGNETYATNNTTPESYVVQEYFRRMVDEGCDACVMEVSSQGLKQSRVYGVYFDYALFTNLESDHIGTNEHADFNEYMMCKAMLFKQCGTAILNTDDVHALDMLKDVRCNVEVYSTQLSGNTTYEAVTNKFGTVNYVEASDIELINDNGTCSIGYTANGVVAGKVRLSIPGRFNIYNSLAALMVCSHFTKDIEIISSALHETNVRGRLEPVKISDRFSLMIDYAHNAMALESLLCTLKEYNPKRLVCLFGCGGNRSKDRRYEMGEVSSRLADLTVVTSDNPRYEKPEDIIADILIGVNKANGKHVVINDRIEAIRYVITNAEDGDVIVLAGKGNEDYQEICGVKHHMDEREIVLDIAKELSD